MATVILDACDQLCSCLPDNVCISFYSLIQTKIGSLEIQLNEALRSSNTRLNVVPETVSGALSNSRTTGDVMDSSAVISKLEEELKKRDALIEV